MERAKCVKMLQKCYHLQGLASLAQTGNGQHGRWQKKGWVVIWKDFSSKIDLDTKRGKFSPAKEARGAPDSRSGHASSNNCCPLLQLLLTLKRLFFIFLGRQLQVEFIEYSTFFNPRLSEQFALPGGLAVARLTTQIADQAVLPQHHSWVNLEAITLLQGVPWFASILSVAFTQYTCFNHNQFFYFMFHIVCLSLVIKHNM